MCTFSISILFKWEIRVVYFLIMSYTSKLKYHTWKNLMFCKDNSMGRINVRMYITDVLSTKLQLTVSDVSTRKHCLSQETERHWDTAFRKCIWQYVPTLRGKTWFRVGLCHYIFFLSGDLWWPWKLWNSRYCKLNIHKESLWFRCQSHSVVVSYIAPYFVNLFKFVPRLLCKLINK